MAQLTYKKDDYFVGSLGLFEALSLLQSTKRNSFVVNQTGDNEYTLIKFKATESNPDQQIQKSKITKEASGFTMKDSGVDNESYPSVDDLVYKSLETNYFLPAKWVIQQQSLIERLKKLKKDLVAGSLFTADVPNTVSHAFQQTKAPQSAPQPQAAALPPKPDIFGKWVLVRERSDPVDEFLRAMKIPDFAIKMIRNLKSQQRITKLSDLEWKVEIITLKTLTSVLRLDGTEVERESQEYDATVKMTSQWAIEDGVWKLTTITKALGKRIGIPTTETTKRYMDGTDFITLINLKADDGTFNIINRKVFSRD